MKIFELDFHRADPQSVIPFVLQHCKPWIDELGGWDNALYALPAYRGVHSGALMRDRITVLPCPVNRAPKDTEYNLHKSLDDRFLKDFGVRYRSNAFFVTGSIGIAKEFGNPAVLCPMGPYSYCWSPRIADLYVTLEEVPIDEIRTPDELVDHLMYIGDYKDSELIDALRSTNEIMLHCKEAVLIPMDIINDIRDSNV